MSVPFCGEIISQSGVSPDLDKIQALRDMALLKTKNELHLFLGIPNYLCKFSPVTTEVIGSLCGLGTSHTKIYIRKQNSSQNICMHEALVCSWIPIPGEPCILN